jgi:hypothetical protein
MQKTRQTKKQSLQLAEIWSATFSKKSTLFSEKSTPFFRKVNVPPKKQPASVEMAS